MTTMYYLQKQGSTASLPLSLLAQNTWHWALRHCIHLMTKHLPGIGNDHADLLNRTHQQVHEWELHPQVLLHYFRCWGTPQITFFQPPKTQNAPSFTSRYPQSMGDALWMNWSGIFAYSFPPLPLLPFLTWKMQQPSQALILVAPTWAIQPWYSALLEMSISPHEKLPNRPQLLTGN